MPETTPEYTKQEDDGLYPCPPGEPLTAGEAALVKSIFGDEINTEQVRKYFSPKEKPGKNPGYTIPAQTFGEDSIKFYGDQYKSTDYSRSGAPFNYGTFVHEMTHIWQNQRRAGGRTDDTSRSGAAYQYILTPDSRFGDFGGEQQSSIIEDYARQFLYTGQTRRMEELPYNLSLLQKLVEDRFPQARKTRLALEAQAKAAPSPFKGGLAP